MPQLRERILRPAPMADDGGGIGQARRFLMTKLPRREPEPLPEGAAEVSGIAEAVAIRDLGNAPVRLGRTGEISPGSLQAAFADVMREIVAAAFEQLL